jgi:hypothetical protein
LASANAGYAVDRTVEGDDVADTGGFHLGDEIGLGEVEAGGFADLEGTHEERGVDSAILGNASAARISSARRGGSTS